MYLNEVKSWHNENFTDEKFVFSEVKESKSHGSMILAKKVMTTIKVKLEELDRMNEDDKNSIF